VKKAPLNAKQLNDSAAADHACFADSTDVFCTKRVSDGASWQGYDGHESPMNGPNSLT
jgi:hypothetical protein